jgi:hypothetical protein
MLAARSFRPAWFDWQDRKLAILRQHHTRVAALEQLDPASLLDEQAEPTVTDPSVHEPFVPFTEAELETMRRLPNKQCTHEEHG